MGHKISKEQIDPGVKDHIMSFVGDIADLETEVNTDIISAVNSLMVDRVDNAENMGKLANAIGEPVTANHSVDEVVEGLGEMLSTFKTNMMNSGVMVESNDKFKSLIDKIKGLTEGEGNKGIQFAEGIIGVSTLSGGESGTTTTFSYTEPLKFTPDYLFLYIPYYVRSETDDRSIVYNFMVDNMHGNIYNSGSPDTYNIQILNITNESFDLYLSWRMYVSGPFTYYAIGVGEEDTTLRDSLASILQEEGVSVTEEDNMASLITKVDEEFTKDNNALETNKQNLITALRNNGKELTGDESFEELVGMVEIEDSVIIKPKNIEQIDTGHSFTAILTNDGKLWICGYNEYGQLGLGDNTDRTIFTQVSNSVKQIACGANHMFILKNDGSVWSCGYNNNGQLGLGDTTNKSKFTQVTTNINNDVKQIACGNAYTFILKNDGSVWSCGYNGYGRLGLGDTNNRTTFTQVTTNINNDVKRIVCGGYHTFILKNDGSVWGCGYNAQGQLGLGDGSQRTTFTQVTTNINNDVKQIACCDFYDGANSPYMFGHTLIIKNDGSLWGAGYNGHGQLGLGDTNNRNTFTQIDTNVNNDVKKVICCGINTFILKNDGSLWSCGYNGYGQLGLGTSGDKDYITFTQVITNVDNDVSDIVCSGNSVGYYCAIKNNGTLWACGGNGRGQFGLGDSTNRSTLVQIFKQVVIDIFID